jgi:hypothetical protein
LEIVLLSYKATRALGFPNGQILFILFSLWQRKDIGELLNTRVGQYVVDAAPMSMSFEALEVCI